MKQWLPGLLLEWLANCGISSVEVRFDRVEINVHFIPWLVLRITRELRNHFAFPRKSFLKNSLGL
jgi:hypothetical protein